MLQSSSASILCRPLLEISLLHERTTCDSGA